jgi:hypothetical protein
MKYRAIGREPFGGQAVQRVIRQAQHISDMPAGLGKPGLVGAITTEGRES